MKKGKVFLIVGARPNFMKVFPLWKVLRKTDSEFFPFIVHTGQHYDYEMSKIFFENLDLPQPHFYLGVGSASHSIQTARIMVRFEKIITREMPDLVVVVGDVNSTLAASLVCAKKKIPLAHIEAGLRSFDWDMPEEINRVVTDRLSNLLFTTCIDANRNLIKEGIKKNRIFFVGNVMIDTLLMLKRKASIKKTLSLLRLRNKQYGLLTLHRPENVDKEEIFKNIIFGLKKISKKIPIVFPAHPRVDKQIRRFRLEREFSQSPEGIYKIEPLGYLDFLNLEMNAKFVLTDSGGIQEETTVLDIPCLTIRKNTERPITVEEGTNVVVGANSERIYLYVNKILNGTFKKRKNIPRYWDGKTSERIVKVLYKQF